jgi:D-serine deaminase-like pyridoxal phosphate-dependent protein
MASMHTAGLDDDDVYAIHNIDRVITPALVVYSEVVDRNIRATLRLLDGDPSRWRPHLKTAKLAFTMSKLLQHGVTQCKCSTTLELKIACEAGFQDVLLAFPVAGAGLRRTIELAALFSQQQVSVLVESGANLGMLDRSGLGVFIDIDPGMNRTGIDQMCVPEIVRLAKAICSRGLRFAGLHYYEGHLGNLPLSERTAKAYQGYQQLMRIARALQTADIEVSEIVTSGTPSFPCALSYAELREGGFVHRVSPGTVVYCDGRSLQQLPADFGYHPAAIIVSTVVSRPSRNRVTCDAGQKSISADLGDPTCEAIDRPELTAIHPSEEHLPMDASTTTNLPSIGDVLHLLPRHICPTVNNFDYAVIVSKGQITAVERVTARGHESYLFPV